MSNRTMDELDIRFLEAASIYGQAAFLAAFAGYCAAALEQSVRWKAEITRMEMEAARSRREFEFLMAQCKPDSHTPSLPQKAGSD